MDERLGCGVLITTIGGSRSAVGGLGGRSQGAVGRLGEVGLLLL